MSKLPDIATLWVGTSLSWIERLTLRSFVHHGHRIILYHTDPIENMDIDGVEMADPRDVFDYTHLYNEQAAPSFIADVFRVHLMSKTDMVWVDTDALCYRPFRVTDGYLFSWSPYYGQIPNGVVRVPKDSTALAILHSFLEQPENIPPWMRARDRKELRDTPPEKRLVRMGQLHRTAFGPPAWTWALRETGEINRALPPSALYPYPWYLADAAFNPNGGVDGGMTDETMSVHLYTAQIRRWNRNKPVLQGSFIERFMREVDFEPPHTPRPLADNA